MRNQYNSFLRVNDIIEMRKNYKAKMYKFVHKIGEQEVDEKRRIKEGNSDGEKGKAGKNTK